MICCEQENPLHRETYYRFSSYGVLSDDNKMFIMIGEMVRDVKDSRKKIIRRDDTIGMAIR
ncbi:hypothetical protein TcasGA2_TC000471 [Tribolium castaneum]|uniref:Uncharacterized protein n=1 Tax=Tribolium castaneum TaxID=7070 RepID=D6WA40_TRICA|nr:hypothetical protein TcasGA2_TC000471 [Tribolium castaneum]